MKITNYTNRKLKPGVTLIELTVVIVVILALISVLFIGANAYRNGASRSACIVKIRTTHQAIRSHQNLNNGFAGGPLVGVPEISDGVPGTFTQALIGADLFLSTAPTCPRDGDSYAGMDDSTYPAAGVVTILCPGFGTGGSTPDGHVFAP